MRNIPLIIRFLHDYLRKLEKDDYDPYAVEKMEAVNELIEELEA